MTDKDKAERMKMSLKLDPHMRWLYDYTHPDYRTPMAHYLRERRDSAIRNAPDWMVREAQLNDALLAAPSVGEKP